MDTGKLISILQTMDKAVYPQVEKLATKIVGKPTKIEFSLPLPTTKKEMDPLVGKKLLRVDFPAKNRSTGMSFVTHTELDDTLAQFLDGESEKEMAVPQSMQMVLELSEGYVRFLNSYLRESLEKELLFENPSLTTWEIPADFNYDATVFSHFQVAIGGDEKLDIMRIFPNFLLSELMGQQSGEDLSLGAYTDSFEEGNGNGVKVLPIEDLYDLQLEVSAELGRTNMTLQKVLDIGKGGIIELNKFAGDPVELFVNKKKFAEGEVVVVDQNFAVRITRLLTDKERLKSISTVS